MLLAGAPGVICSYLPAAVALTAISMHFLLGSNLYTITIHIYRYIVRAFKKCTK